MCEVRDSVRTVCLQIWDTFYPIIIFNYLSKDIFDVAVSHVFWDIFDVAVSHVFWDIFDIAVSHVFWDTLCISIDFEIMLFQGCQ